MENRHVHIKRYVEEVESFPLSISLVGAGTGFERWKMQTFPLCPWVLDLTWEPRDLEKRSDSSPYSYSLLYNVSLMSWRPSVILPEHIKKFATFRKVLFALKLKIAFLKLRWASPLSLLSQNYPQRGTILWNSKQNSRLGSLSSRQSSRVESPCTVHIWGNKAEKSKNGRGNFAMRWTRDNPPQIW